MAIFEESNSSCSITRKCIHTRNEPRLVVYWNKLVIPCEYCASYMPNHRARLNWILFHHWQEHSTIHLINSFDFGYIEHERLYVLLKWCIFVKIKNVRASSHWWNRILITSIETNRKHRFWVKINIKLSLSCQLIVFFGCLECGFVSDCHFWQSSINTNTVASRFPWQVLNSPSMSLQTIDFLNLTLGKLYIARHLCYQSETERQIWFYLTKLLQTHELVICKFWMPVLK